MPWHADYSHTSDLLLFRDSAPAPRRGRLSVWSSGEYYPACGQFYGPPQFKYYKIRRFTPARLTWVSPRPLDFIGSSYAARVLCTRLQIAHSNVCKSTPGRASAILTSIIGALHFGQAGRSSATNGMTDDRRLDWGMMLTSNRRERNTLC